MKRTFRGFATDIAAYVAATKHLDYQATDEPTLSLGRVATPLALFVATGVSFTIARSQPNADHVLAVMAVLMASALISSVGGFAFSAIAGISIYHLVESPLEAVTIMMFSSISIQLYSVVRLWRSITWLQLTPFLFGGCLTVVPFSWLVLHISASMYLVAIGVLLITYGAYMLLRKPVTLKVSAGTGLALDVVAGGLGGITGPLAAFPGAAITVWCGMRGWGKIHQRATYQPFILIMQVVSLVLISSMGGSGSFVFDNAIYVMPAVLGCHLGLLVFQKLSNSHFNYLVYSLLIVSGLSMILK